MNVYINPVLVTLALLSWNMCAVAAATEIVLGSQATVLLENCSCGGDECCAKEPEPAGFTVNCSTVRAGLTLTGCGDSAGSPPAVCTAVSEGGDGKTLNDCNFSTAIALRGDSQCGSSPCTRQKVYTVGSSGDECSGRKIKLTSSPNNCNVYCSSISGENRTINEPPEQVGQNGDTPRATSSSNAVASALKSPHDTDTVVSKPTQNSSNSTPHVPKSNKHDESSEKLSAANSTTTSTKNDAQSEGRELCAMEVGFKCAAASLFIFSSFF
ncbi:hypothetical protein ERJ75_000156200 [Trypanosoma vivax]|nr:hypothetical protein ERJ75_000156200 [Trypanosoma vivax]